jgi:outer membrane protein OmpA-like peptidoglycan-associated protein
MKKFFSLMIAFVAMFALSMNAQTVENSNLLDNTYLRLEGGATALTHPGCMGYEDLGHSIQGVVGAEIGKWITPKFGVAFEGDFGIRNGSKFGYFNYEYIGLDGDGNEMFQKAKRFNYITVTGLVKFNMSNIVAGWNPDRKWEFVLATGPMWIHGFPGKNYENDFGVKFKGEVNYNVNDRWQINLAPELNYNLTGLYSYGTYEHPRFDIRNAWYGLMAGVTYKFGKQFTECPYRYTQAQWDKLNAELNDARARQPEVVTHIVEKAVPTNVVPAYYISFDYGKADLDETAMNTINEIKKYAKENPNVVFDIKGEASYPGSTEFNKKLSTDRAEAVKNALDGVKIGSVEGLGETGHQIVTVVLK